MEWFEFKVEDINEGLDLLYSDAVFYKEQEVNSIDRVFEEIEKFNGVLGFNTYKSDIKFPM